MTLPVGDSRAFVLAALKGRPRTKKPSTDGPSTGEGKKTKRPPTKKHRSSTANPEEPVVVVTEPPPAEQVKRLRQDTLQWKLLSAQPEDFGDAFDEDDPASDGENKASSKTATKPVAKRAKSGDPMTNLFDNEGGMMMLEEVDGVDVMWEEDGKGGKKAILVVSPS